MSGKENGTMGGEKLNSDEGKQPNVVPSKPVGEPIRLTGHVPKSGWTTPAHVVMFSGCTDDQESADVSDTVRGDGAGEGRRAVSTHPSFCFFCGWLFGFGGSSAHRTFGFVTQERSDAADLLVSRSTRATTPRRSSTCPRTRAPAAPGWGCTS
jgi:hypothetical protein